MSPQRVSAAGRKRGIFGRAGRKQGSGIWWRRGSGIVACDAFGFSGDAAVVRAKPIDVMSLLAGSIEARSRLNPGFDHDFVIAAGRR
jgi:hypothetical protein